MDDQSQRRRANSRYKKMKYGNRHDDLSIGKLTVWAAVAAAILAALLFGAH